MKNLISLQSYHQHKRRLVLLVLEWLTAALATKLCISSQWKVFAPALESGLASWLGLADLPQHRRCCASSDSTLQALVQLLLPFLGSQPHCPVDIAGGGWERVWNRSQQSLPASWHGSPPSQDLMANLQTWELLCQAPKLGCGWRCTTRSVVHSLIFDLASLWLFINEQGCLAILCISCIFLGSICRPS